MRTYDVAAFQAPPTPTQQAPQQLWELSGNGHAVTGIIKLAQIVLLELLTVKGSQPFTPARGTSLLQFARQGRIRNEIDAHVYFQYAVGELEQNLATDVTSDTPDDERFAALDVLSVTFSFERVAYRLRLTSVAGDTRELILPVTALP